MVFQSHSYRTHVSYLEKRREVLAMYGLDRVYSKSSMHGWAKKLGAEVDRVVTLMRMQAEANGDADGPLSGGASGFSQMTYKDWEDGKKKIVSRRMSDKLHILMAPNGMIVMCGVTPGGAHDPPVFRRMSECVPKGSGYVRLDATYPARENCEMIAQGGRIPVIRPIKPPRKGIQRHGQDAQMAQGGSGWLQQATRGASWRTRVLRHQGEVRGGRPRKERRHAKAAADPQVPATASRHNCGSAAAIYGAQRMPYSDRRYCGQNGRTAPARPGLAGFGAF